MIYKEILKIIKNSSYTIKRLRDYKKDDKKVILLRHDVDIDINIAYNMALIENELGINSTYFVLHTADYFINNKTQNSSLYIYREMQRMWHEIGIHNNELVFRYLFNTAKKSYCKLDLKSALEFLRENGIDVVGTSSHGDSNLSKIGKNVMNYDLFLKEPLSKFGLNYEALHIKFDYYNSDAGGKFWYKGGDPIKEIKEGKYNVIQLNLHPIWWKNKI